MPYSDPEGKRRWEREHRQQRNERRRKRRLNAGLPVNVQNTMFDPAVGEYLDSRNGGAVFVLAMVLFSVGLLLIALLTRKAGSKYISDPALDPQTLEKQSR
jgi:hypothetical protein